MTKFRPCIDLHAGSVKQIVGGTLSDTLPSNLRTNFTSTYPASYYAQLYRDNSLTGAHVILLGPGNDAAAKEALSTWPGGLQVGGGVTDLNAQQWIEAGAEKVIITSFLFPSGKFSLDRLKSVLKALGNDTSKLVIDLSCRRVTGRSSSSTNNATSPGASTRVEHGNDGDDEGKNLEDNQVRWFVAMNKWQTITEMEITQETISLLEPYCSEFLIHAADNEGLQSGVDHALIRALSNWCSIPVTYAGGARSLGDLDLVKTLSKGKIDLTIGSALDIFGGQGCTFVECCDWNSRQ